MYLQNSYKRVTKHHELRQQCYQDRAVKFLGSTIRTLLHGKIGPLKIDRYRLSLGDVGFLLFFRENSQVIMANLEFKLHFLNYWAYNYNGKVSGQIFKAASHDKKPQKVAFWKGNGTPYFRRSRVVKYYNLATKYQWTFLKRFKKLAFEGSSVPSTLLCMSSVRFT